MHTVAVIAFEGISPFHLSVPCIVFGDDLDRLSVPRYRLLICGEKPGLISTMSGFRIEVEHNLSVLEQADTVIMPAWRDPAERAPQALLDALRCASACGARIAGLCLGTFVVAEAGLLDGRTAATHWAWADDFAQRYPRVRLDRDSLYIDDGAILTSAGTAAALDCCLHLVRRDHGAEVANRVARRMVVAPHRHGGQAQYIEHPLPRTPDASTAATREWALAHLAEPLSLRALAERANMSVRTFTRHFRDETGVSPTQWLLQRRVDRARHLLETTDLGVDQIARKAGLGTAASLRQHLQTSIGVAPSAYRRTFRLVSPPPAG
jgi:transcriptional regulator GlxA family with amidase domain